MSKNKENVTTVEFEEVEVLEAEVAEENAKKAVKKEKEPLTKERVIHGLKKAGGYVLAAVGGFIGAVAIGVAMNRDKEEDDDDVIYYLDEGEEDSDEEEE